MNHSPDIALHRLPFAVALATPAPFAHSADAADNKRLPTTTVTTLFSVRHDL